MPKTSGPLWSAKLKTRLPKSVAVAGVVELALRRERARVERRRGRDDLERRAGDEAARGGAVEQRRRRLAGRRDRLDRVEVGLDEVRVEGRRRGEGEHPARRRLDAPRRRRTCRRGPRSAARCASRSSVVTTSFPCARDPAELVERRVEDRAQVRVRGRQEVVHGLLEAGPRAPDRRVADGVRGQRPARVAAKVPDRAVLQLPLAVRWPAACGRRPRR